MKTLWFVGGSLEAIPGIRLARRMGLRVVVSDKNPQAPAFALAHDHVVVSTFDVEATVAAARRYHKTVHPLDGVISVGTDVPVTVASVAKELGLPGIPVEAARLSTDKLAMKERLAADGIAVPWFAPVESAEHLQAIAAESPFPLIVKPVDSRGSRGVLRLRPGMDLTWAYETARRFSPTGRVMVEQFLEGPQVSTESVILDGVAYSPAFADRNYEEPERFAPHVIERGGETPSNLPATIQEAIHDLIQRSAQSLGIRSWTLKGDIVVHKGKPYVIEFATRLSGGFFCTHHIPAATGVNLVEQAIRLALGEPVNLADLQPKHRRWVCARILFPTPGRIRSIRGVAAARQYPGVLDIIMGRGPGDIIPPPTDSNAGAGFVLAVGDSREEAVARTLAAMAAIEVETEPV